MVSNLSGQQTSIVTGHCYGLGYECGPSMPNLHQEHISFTRDSFFLVHEYWIVMEGMENAEDSIFRGLRNARYEGTLSGHYLWKKDTAYLYCSRWKQVYRDDDKTFRNISDSVQSQTFKLIKYRCGILPGFKFSDDTGSLNIYVDTSYQHCKMDFISNDFGTKEYIRIVRKGFVGDEIFYKSEKGKQWIKLEISGFGNYPFAGFEAKFPGEKTTYQFIPSGEGIYNCQNLDSGKFQQFKLTGMK